MFAMYIANQNEKLFFMLFLHRSVVNYHRQIAIPPPWDFLFYRIQQIHLAFFSKLRK